MPRVIHAARAIFNPSAFSLFNPTEVTAQTGPLYVANSPLSFIARRATRDVTHAVAPRLILPGIKVLITLGLITLGSNLRRVILYGRINCRLR